MESPAAIAIPHPDIVYPAFDPADLPPEHIRALLDALEVALVAGRFRPLPGALHTLQDAGDAFRAMAHGRSVGKSILRVPPRGMVVRPDRSYVVTGGSGALGLLAARALAEAGAGEIVLVSRGATRAPPELPAPGAPLNARGQGHACQAALEADAALSRALGPALRREALPGGSIVIYALPEGR